MMAQQMTDIPTITRGGKTRLAAATSRQEFVELAVELLGGPGPAAARLGVTRAVFWHWARKALSVEAAVTLAEQLAIPYEGALQWSERRIGRAGRSTKAAKAKAAMRSTRSSSSTTRTPPRISSRPSAGMQAAARRRSRPA